MCIAVIGGIVRLEPHYRQEADKLGVELRLFNTLQTGMDARLRHVDALVIFTNKVSHAARREAIGAARSRDIPVYQFHACGLCTLRDCLKCLHEQGGGAPAR
jgi:hypothetical protein